MNHIDGELIDINGQRRKLWIAQAPAGLRQVTASSS